MANLLIIYSTTDGHTIEICNRLKQVIEGQDHRVEVVAVEKAEQADLRSFDKIVIGASIRYGRHSPRVVEFINKNQTILESKPNAFFSVNAVARKPGRDQPANNPYLRKLLRQISWKPANLAVFAGKIDYPRYGWFDRSVIRLIMWITKGPTDPNAVVEFTDWRKVEEFGLLVSNL